MRKLQTILKTKTIYSSGINEIKKRNDLNLRNTERKSSFKKNITRSITVFEQLSSQIQICQKQYTIKTAAEIESLGQTLRNLSLGNNHGERDQSGM